MTRPRPAWLLLIALSLPALAAPMTPGDIAALLAPARALDPATDAGLRARIDLFGASLRGSVYRRDPLGEGPGARIDPDPLLRFDAFDCVTYVETVLALARSTEAAQVAQELLSIRYRDGAPSFGERNHLPSLDWLPNALQRRIVADITAELFAAPLLSTLTVRVDRDAAIRRLAHGAALEPATAGQVSRPVEATLRFIAARALGRHDAHGRFIGARDDLLAQIPDGAVLLVVAPSSPSLRASGIAEGIAHFGFAARDAHGRLLLRSATTLAPAGVRDLDFERYLARAPGRVQGFIVLRALPPPR